MSNTKISVTIGGSETSETYTNIQTVNFVHFFGKAVLDFHGKEDYATMLDEENDKKDIIFASNYTAEESNSTDNDYAKQHQGISDENTNLFSDLSIFRREIWPERNENFVRSGGEHIYKPIAVNVTKNRIKDYSLLNNRNYEYVVYYTPFGANKDETHLAKFHVKTEWSGWTLTELTKGSNENEYIASDKDVWIFRYGISTGEVQQQFSKTQQDTLSKYPVFSIGPKSNLYGSVGCYMGEDILPYVYTVDEYKYVKNDEEWEWILSAAKTGKNIGGYIEKKNTDVVTSNKQVDMLESWRSICSSGNPKLLRDQKGNGYIVQITEASDETRETWNKMPVFISFSWMQIGDVKDYTIIGR